MEDKKRQYEQLAFAHQVLSQRQNYFLEEFEIAKDTIRLITSLANALADEIRAAESIKADSESFKNEAQVTLPE